MLRVFDVDVPAANAPVFAKGVEESADMYVESYIRKKRPGGTVAACSLDRGAREVGSGRGWKWEIWALPGVGVLGFRVRGRL